MNADEQNQNGMSAVKAYAILAAALIIVVLLFKPWVSELQDARQRLKQAQASLTELRQLQSATDQRLEQHRQQIAKQLARKEIIAANSDNEVQRRLQNAVKTLAQHASVNIRQMRPLPASMTGEVNSAQLELNLDLDLQASPSALSVLLSGLLNEQMQPKLNALSVRANTWTKQLNEDGYRTTNSLSVTARLQQDWVAPDTLANMRLTESSDLKSLPDLNHPNQSHRQQSASLAGLFDLRLRSRERQNDLAFYAVSAISITDRSRSALLTDTLTNTSQKLVTGDTLDGWSLTAINNTELTFSKHDKSLTLRISR